MTESEVTQKDIKKIKWHVENLDNKMDLMMRGNEEVNEAVAKIFRDNPTTCEVFLAVDGEKTQAEIAEETCNSQATVSRRIKELDKAGLIRKKDYAGGHVYQKDEICRTLQLGQKVTEDGWDG